MLEPGAPLPLLKVPLLVLEPPSVLEPEDDCPNPPLDAEDVPLCPSEPLAPLCELEPNEPLREEEEPACPGWPLCPPWLAEVLPLDPLAPLRAPLAPEDDPGVEVDCE